MEQVEWLLEVLKWYTATRYNCFEQVCSWGRHEALKKLLKGKDLTFIISSRGSGRSYYAKYIDKMAGLYGSWVRGIYDQYLFDLRE